MPRISAQALLDHVIDPGTFTSWDTLPRYPEHRRPTGRYADELAAAAGKSGASESIVTGAGEVAGRRVAFVAGEFDFLAGSVGLAAAERLTHALERATAERLPVLASPTSGGTRMQEGTLAFLQMVKITQAVAAHKSAGLPYLVYLRNPTTGGVFASWGSLGHITVAEPGALIGFLGPRVYEALYHAKFPPGVQTAEHLYETGLVDAVVPPEQLRRLAVTAMNHLMPKDAGPCLTCEAHDSPIDDGPRDFASTEGLPSLHAWESIERSRRTDRPGMRELLTHAASQILPLSGTLAGERASGLMLALACFGGTSCVVAGQDRHGQSFDTPLGPEALREARRGMRLAQEFHLPLVTIIDTPGAALSPEAEEGGLAGEIARCLHDLVILPTATLSVLIGQGCGGGALALVPADHAIAAQHAWLSPLPPEGASAIVYRDTAHAPHMAHEQGVKAIDLFTNGIVDAVVPEYPDAADEPVAFCRRMGQAIHDQIAELTAQDDATRMAARFDRFRHLGA